MNDLVTVVLSGPFTDVQKERVRHKMDIRRDKVIAAMDWLRQNNAVWVEMFGDEDVEIPTPVVIDKR